MSHFFTDYKLRYPGNDISPLAWIHQDVKMGTGNRIGPFCIIGGPAEWKGHEDSGRVWIGSNNTFTGHVTVDSGAEGDTYIGDDCYLLKHCHVGHDCDIANGVTIACGAKIGGHTTVAGTANIGLNAVIHQRQLIAYGSMIGMGAVVTKTLLTEAYKIYAGNPAKLIGDNVRHPQYQPNV